MAQSAENHLAFFGGFYPANGGISFNACPATGGKKSNKKTFCKSCIHSNPSYGSRKKLCVYIACWREIRRERIAMLVDNKPQERKTDKKEMTKESKKYLIKTLVAVALMLLGAWGISMGGKVNLILGAICFLIGFIICLVIYGLDFLQWWR